MQILLDANARSPLLILFGSQNGGGAGGRISCRLADMPEKLLTLRQCRDALQAHWGLDVPLESLRYWFWKHHGPQQRGFSGRAAWYALSEFTTWVENTLARPWTAEEKARRSEYTKRAVATRRARAGSA